MQKLLSLEQVAALLHISPSTARLRISRGSAMPPSFRTGRRRLFLEQAVTEWLMAQAGDASNAHIQPEQVRAGRKRRDDAERLA